MFQEFNDVQKSKNKKHLLANNWTELDVLIESINNEKEKKSNKNDLLNMDFNHMNFNDFGNKKNDSKINIYERYDIKELHGKAIFIE